MTSITGTMGHRCLRCRLQEMSLNLFILVSSVAGTSLLQYSYTGQSVRLQRDVVKEGINKKVRQKEMIRQTFFFFFLQFYVWLVHFAPVSLYFSSVPPWFSSLNWRCSMVHAHPAVSLWKPYIFIVILTKWYVVKHWK